MVFYPPLVGWWSVTEAPDEDALTAAEQRKGHSSTSTSTSRPPPEPPPWRPSGPPRTPKPGSKPHQSPQCMQEAGGHAGGAVGVAAAAFLRMSLLPQAALVHMGRLGIILVLL